jgi:branched-subunit amino acid transport protein
MTSRLRRWLRDPLFLLCLAAGLLAFVVQSGELGTSDTTHRLQTTHWLWTSEPQVFPNEYPEFGLHGRGGRLYSWYGIGQSLLMLPADLLGTWIARWPVFSDYGDDPPVRSIVVSYLTNMLVTIFTALIAFRLLGQLRFSTKESVAGVLALLFATTHLHYTQNMMENNYIMLLTLTGFSFQYEWLRTHSRRALFTGSCALGLNLLTRLTTGLDLIAGGIFVLLVLWFEGAGFERAGLERGRSGGARLERAHGSQLWRRFIAYCKVAAPVYLFFVALDRAYQFYRFESFTNTYVSIFAREYRQRDPTLPANFPWSTPFHAGFLGPLFQPEKSIFLFDPLLLLAIVLLALLWKRLTPEVRAYGAASLLLLLAYICFYARYAYWSGDFAWGDRYVSTAVELATLLAVPLLMRYRERLGRTNWRAGWAVVAVSLMIQLASLAFWLPLEIYQMETLGHPTFVIALRFKNILAFAFGKMDAWGLNNHVMTEDPWDYVHITTWNFLPFLLRRVGAAPVWVVNVALVIWLAATAALGAVLLRLRSSLRRSHEGFA